MMLERTSGLLADLTDCTAMVVGPSHESAAIRSVHSWAWARGSLWWSWCWPTVPSRSSPSSSPTRSMRCSCPPAAARLAAHSLGVPLTKVGPKVATTGDPATDAVVAVRAQRPADPRDSEGGDQLFVGGSSRMVAAFDAVETVRSVLSILEQQLVVVTLLRDILDTGLSVAIGTEHGMEPLASCAIVVMPVSVDGMEVAPSGCSAPPA